ncbi:ATP-binding cassette domain-containing protein [Maribellus comscasis]|uniref:ATP-binding cassette domain-containing protein n=1 Tax=Maribellus comscasis TaxID=2681766 RepID=A0A6I6JYU1_9BACT|nr:peptidase domain-containing ABC transporter [Maribellus comscasis]QGY42844.1 ATP-binding cassette domain-containing protein [Maribellus comscasis]
MSKFPFYQQYDAMDCGPSCLRMVAKYYGKHFSTEFLREKSFITREGVSLLGISDAAEGIGLRSMGVKISFGQLKKEAPLPCIVHWGQNHFVVVYKFKKGKVFVADPAFGRLEYSESEFRQKWLATVKEGEEKGICLLLQPTPDFYQEADEKVKRTGFRFVLNYLKPYRKLVIQLLLGFFLGSLIQLVLPFLTQSIIDVGISNQDIGFIYLVLAAQMVLFISRMSVDFIRSWILLHISTRINISIISDFLIKLMKLPLGFFDSKMIGDILQRIEDHGRIERFLTAQSIGILFSMFSLVIFAVVLAIYSLKILLIFIVGSVLYFVWVYIFMKRRRELDYKRFRKLSENQSKLIQIINGMQEIKLNNYEKEKRWEWERIQAGLFKVSVKSLALEQYQNAGSVFINETKNILIIVIAATGVINGELTLGMMLAIQYILGQLNSPLRQLIYFMHQAQDAKISLERLAEIHEKKDEQEFAGTKVKMLPENKSISISNLVFQYEGPRSPKVLNNINLEIPENKTTAIVGTSGSGKTTLIKLMLGFYQPVEGEIKIGGVRLANYYQPMWRDKCGVVMQDGFIFSDSIARNIVVSEGAIDEQLFLHAVKMANIQDYIDSLPLSYNTVIGQEGSGLSQGQKQRILIARAIYKNPSYLFFDEATNALDANNEKLIMENMDEFSKGKTVVVVAHRLSTVKNADQIVVLEKGQIVEIGKHQELIDKKGKYYRLVKNQLELGS